MSLWELFLGFFTANVLGYGGGPSSIPLMQQEIVHHYGWMDNGQFANVLALGNALPGPISTKIAAFVGYSVSGWLGVLVALIATIVPSALALVVLLRVLERFRGSTVVKGMTLMIQPVIAVLMLVLTWETARDSFLSIGWLQTLLIAAVAFWAMQRRKIHPALVIVCAFVYGGLVLPHVTTL